MVDVSEKQSFPSAKDRLKAIRLTAFSLPEGHNVLSTQGEVMTQLPDQPFEVANLRVCDPYLDRRSGEDNRLRYSLSYFSGGGTERRIYKERRKKRERRRGYVRISPWTSVGTAV